MCIYIYIYTHTHTRILYHVCMAWLDPCEDLLLSSGESAKVAAASQEDMSRRVLLDYTILCYNIIF